MISLTNADRKNQMTFFFLTLDIHLGWKLAIRIKLTPIKHLSYLFCISLYTYSPDQFITILASANPGELSGFKTSGWATGFLSGMVLEVSGV
jgi:hypothetical protein